MNTLITPVAVYPETANTLYIRAGNLGPPPAYYYELQKVEVVIKSREVPNPAYKPASIDADGNAVPASGTPTITEPYQDSVVTVLKNGNVNMTEAQWQAWPANADDDEYQLDAISSNLGLTRV